MKRFLPILGFLLLTSPCWATWTLVQHPTKTACGTSVTTCVITVTSTGSGNLGILTAHWGGTLTGHISAVSAGGTWAFCASSGCKTSDATAGAVDIAYTLSTTSGVTSMTVTFSSTTTAADLSFDEYSTNSGPPILDTFSTRTVSTAAANLAGVTLTIGGANDIILQAGTFSGTASGCGTEGGTANSPNDFPTGNATCGFINTTTGTANTYVNTSANAALSAIAFKETGAAAAPCQSRSLMGVGC